MDKQPPLPLDSDAAAKTKLEPRRLPQGCQVETKFSDGEWADFVVCARKVWESGEFRHAKLEKEREDHPEATDELIVQAICNEATLVAYRDDGRERVTLWDRYGTALVVVAVLKDGS